MSLSLSIRVGGALAAAALVGGLMPVSASAALVPLDHGHVDVIDVGYEDGSLEIGVHDESVEPDVERDPSSVKFVVKPEAKIQVPAEPEYAFLGPANSTVWLLPETQDEHLLWPGVATEELEPGTFVADSVRIRLRAVVGAGDLSIFTNDPFGNPQVLLDSGDGLPDHLDVPIGTHRHYSWSFDQPGYHAVIVDAKAKLAATGQTVRSELTPLIFQVKN